MFKKCDPSQSALPLKSMSAIVLDTETTGLDTLSDRIVQIGAVRMVVGRCDKSDVFDRLVNPAMTIPERSTAIHGINDNDVLEAEEFAAIMPRFAAWAGSGVVLGYAIGFDLAMLKAEHDRAGLPWHPPRSLDVAHLVQLLAPNLPSTALDPVASWLGIDIQDRHQALGDALLTAEIYLAILPKLRAKGIFTLAEAERACLALTSRIDEEIHAGWHVTGASRKPAALIDQGDHARIDSLPYRHRLRELMRSPPVTIANDMAVGKALHLMMEHQVSSVFLPPLEDAKGFGILTERDVLRAIDRAGADALNEPSGRYAKRPLVSMDQDDFVYRAISRMAAMKARHLGVTNEEGEIVGALSARDLLKQRASEAITLGDQIDKAQSAAELGSIWGGLAAVANTLVREDVDVLNIAAIISNELLALTRRACEIAEQELSRNGQGPPPVPYAMLVLGSGGRGESLLAMDQDNAIVYQKGEPGSDVDQWFEALGQRVSTMLDDAGVTYCKGGVMASNAAWRMDVAHWQAAVAEWVQVSSPINILNADIFFDGRPIHGDLELGETLLQDALEAARRSPSFLASLSVHATDFDTPFGWFGRIKLEDGRVDLKRGGLMALFSTARVLALRFGLNERSTRDRFLAVGNHLDHEKEVVADLIEAHRLILNTILRQQLRDLNDGIPLSNSIKLSDQTSLQRQSLKWALNRIPRTADLLGTPPML